MSRAGTLRKRKLSKPEPVEWKEIWETLAEWYRSTRAVTELIKQDTMDTTIIAMIVKRKRSARQINNKLWDMAKKLHLLGY